MKLGIMFAAGLCAALSFPVLAQAQGLVRGAKRARMKVTARQVLSAPSSAAPLRCVGTVNGALEFIPIAAITIAIGGMAIAAATDRLTAQALS